MVRRNYLTAPVWALNEWGTLPILICLIRQTGSWLEVLQFGGLLAAACLSERLRSADYLMVCPDAWSGKSYRLSRGIPCTLMAATIPS